MGSLETRAQISAGQSYGGCSHRCKERPTIITPFHKFWSNWQTSTKRGKPQKERQKRNHHLRCERDQAALLQQQCLRCSSRLQSLARLSTSLRHTSCLGSCTTTPCKKSAQQNCASLRLSDRQAGKDMAPLPVATRWCGRLTCGESPSSSDMRRTSTKQSCSSGPRSISHSVWAQKTFAPLIQP